MQVTITPQAVITAASLLAALGSLGGMAAWWVRFIDRDKRQDAELKAIRREQTLLCHGMTACLKGMKEQGCNGFASGFAETKTFERLLDALPAKVWGG